MNIKDIDNKIIIIHNDSERDEFLSLMETMGNRWNSGDSPTNYTPRSTYPYGISFNSGKLQVDGLWGNTDKFINYSDIFNFELYKSGSGIVILTYGKMGIVIKTNTSRGFYQYISPDIWWEWDMSKFDKIDSVKLIGNVDIKFHRNNKGEILMINSLERMQSELYGGGIVKTIIHKNGIRKYDNDDGGVWYPITEVLIKNKKCDR